MPMKPGLRPKMQIVIRDLRRGGIRAVTKEGEIEGTLQLSFIPEQHHPEENPNHPLETDVVRCWDTNRYRWNTFKISELEEYVGAVEIRTKKAEDPRRAGNQSTEETPQET